MSIGKRFILVSILYAIAGMTLGIIMGMHKDFSLMHLHAHINLIGWVAMAIFGLIYKAFPQMAASKIGTVHFYLANIGAAIQLVGIYLVLTSGFEPAIIIGSMITVISIFVFLVNFVKNAKE
jgi:hypothetical protein